MEKCNAFIPTVLIMITFFVLIMLPLKNDVPCWLFIVIKAMTDYYPRNIPK